MPMQNILNDLSGRLANRNILEKVLFLLFICAVPSLMCTKEILVFFWKQINLMTKNKTKNTINH